MQIRGRYYHILIMVTILLASTGCEKGTEFRRDPNLQLLSKTRPIREGWLDYDLVFPVWSADDMIYYIASEDVSLCRPRGNIWCVNADGTDDTLWAEGKYSYLDISPAGNHLLAIENPVESYGDRHLDFWTPGDIVLFHTVTKQETRVTATRDILSAVFISNDRGLGIVFFRYGWPGSSGFYRIGLDGDNLELLYETGEDICFGFDVSPDGEYLVGTGNTFHIGLKQFLEAFVIEDWVFFPRYSPDGTMIIFGNSNYLYEQGQVFVKDIATGERRKLAMAVYDPKLDHGRAQDDLNFPYWSPDGTKIVFSATRSYGDPARRHAYEIWVANELP